MRIASFDEDSQEWVSTVTVPERVRIASRLSLLKIFDIDVTVPMRVRIASAKGYNSCNKN